MLEKWFGTSKGGKVLHMNMDKQMFDKQIFAGTCRVSGTQREIFNRLFQVPAFLHTRVLLQLPMVVTPFLQQVLYLQSFRKLGGRLDFLGLSCFVCYQYEIIHIPKRHFGVASFAPPKRYSLCIYTCLISLLFLTLCCGNQSYRLSASTLQTHPTPWAKAEEK